MKALPLRDAVQALLDAVDLDSVGRQLVIGDELIDRLAAAHAAHDYRDEVLLEADGATNGSDYWQRCREAGERTKDWPDWKRRACGLEGMEDRPDLDCEGDADLLDEMGHDLEAVLKEDDPEAWRVKVEYMLLRLADCARRALGERGAK